jgi:hypothetical protein
MRRKTESRKRRTITFQPGIHLKKTTRSLIQSEVSNWELPNTTATDCQLILAFLFSTTVFVPGWAYSLSNCCILGQAVTTLFTVMTAITL